MKYKTFGFQYLKDVVSLSYDEKKCTGCGRCTDVCPHRVFEMSGKKAILAEKNLCIECGACALNCPAEAITVSPGVGCAAAIIMSWLTGKEPTCGCAEEGCCG